mmetsp:Transcript_38823/g.76324  ORF Transcript_38823/g.76324 Transcript_38823/m.76324 type:complete len:89 (+) Transcript_38823:1807-2073(+)
MLRPALVGSDEGQVDLRVDLGGQLDLCRLGCLPESLQGEAILCEVDTLLLLELVNQVLEKLLIEILSSEGCVSVRGLHLKHASRDLQN